MHRYGMLEPLPHSVRRPPCHGRQKKQNLPEKLCVQCRRPFCWRKKWEKVWDEVKYCSDQCRRNSKRQRPEQ